MNEGGRMITVGVTALVLGVVIGAVNVGLEAQSELRGREQAYDEQIVAMQQVHRSDIQTLEHENARLRSRNGALNAAVQGFEAREAERQAELERIAQEQRLAERVAAIIAEMNDE